MKNREEKKPGRRKSLLDAWRERRASTAPIGEGLQTTAPMPPGEASPVMENTPPSSSPRDDCGRPQQRTHQKAPIGGPFTAR